MSGNPLEEIGKVNLSKLNMLGCGLFLMSTFCCCGGVGAEWFLLGEIFPNGAVVPVLLFIVPVFGAALVFVSGRSILESNGYSIYRGKRKKKRKKKRRPDPVEDEDEEPPRRRRSPRDDAEGDDDEPPRKNRQPPREDEEDEPPRRRKRPPRGDED